MTGLLPNALPRPASVQSQPGPRFAASRYPLLTAGVILAVAVLNVAYLLADCPLELAPDEAHYWDWSRHLDWSYYSKGPLVAWLIRGSRELFGSLSVAAVGSEILAVRLPAVGCQALLLAAVYVLASRTLSSLRLALACVLVAISLPPVAALGVLMTIDSPYLAAWAWACVFAHSALLRDGGNRAWAAAGGVVAVGVLAKYTMVLFPLSVAAYLWVTPSRRDEFRRSGFWLMCGLAAAGMLPVLYWNVVHHWVGVRHVFALASGAGGKPRPWVDPFGLPAYLAGQYGTLVGFWFLAFLAAAWASRPSRVRNLQTGFLWWLSVPLWLFFAAASIRKSGQPNWPAAAYLTGLILAVGWMSDQWPHPIRRRWLIRGIVLFTAIGLVVSYCGHYPFALRAVVARVGGSPTAEEPTPVRKLDPTSRLAGWQALAAEVDRLRERVRQQTGQDPVLAGMVWTVPGELGFYCRGNPQAYSLGSIIADRWSQYDEWRPNPIDDAQVFRDRTFLYVGEQMPEMSRAFERVEPPVEVVASDGGIPVAAWKIWVCHGFRGFPADDRRRPARGY